MKEPKKQELIEIKLPSGNVMKMNISSFENGKNLYQTILKEANSLDINSSTELDEKLMLKIGMLALSSAPIEKAIWACFDKVLIDGEKLTEDYFDVVENREDFILIMIEVAKANITPFMKSLFAQFSQLFQQLKNTSQA